MTIEQALKIREFSINWITKVVAKRKDYRERLLDAINEVIPDETGHDPYSFLSADTWDSGKYGGLGCLCDDWFGKYRAETGSPFWHLTDYACNDLICTLRIAIDLYIEQSGGVVGYTIGDLRKVFDGNIPDEIASIFEGDISKADDQAGVWL